MNDGSFHADPFSYGNTGEPTEHRNADTESGFRPPFSLPESLLQNLPLSKKVHQIIARTATFVRNHGGQSEIVLRVKQGDNPTFGFLMPDHHLHMYFRFLVDHPELLTEENKTNNGLDQNSSVGGVGALSLLGSVYGTGEDEDEDGANEDAPEPKRNETNEVVGTVNASVSNGSKPTEPSVSVAGKEETVSKLSLTSLKEKAPLIKKNQSISAVKARTPSGAKKEGDTVGSSYPVADKSEAAALPRMSKVDIPILEPPSDMKRAVDKIVEFILRNGKEFEAVLVEQDQKYGRFPFLLPSNLYYPYYLKVLCKAEESKLHGKGSVSEKCDSTGLGVGKKTTSFRESEMMSDIPYDSARKEKFTMKIGKAKKDVSDIPSKPTEPDNFVTVDAAAAILQAATRGIRNPNLEILTKMSVTDSSQGRSSDGGLASSLGSLHASRPESSNQKLDQKGEPSVSVPVANAIAKSAAVAAASEADSSEAGLTREQKLKAERLKRAKMFAAMMKSKAEPLKTEQRCLSVEPPESRFSGSGGEFVNLVSKEREGSSVPFDDDTTDKNEKFEKKDLVDGVEQRSKRKYRSRSTRNEEGDELDEEIKDYKHSKRKHRSHRSSHRSRDRKRHSSSRDKDSRRHHKRHDSSSDNEHQRSRHHHKRDSSDDEHRYSRHRHNHDSQSDDEHVPSRRHRHNSQSDDDTHRHGSGSLMYRKKSHPEKQVELEEGEIKSDQSKVSEGDAISREASVDVSKSHRSREASVDLSKSWQDRGSSQPSNADGIPDDLRAKIRAMLMATL